MHQAEIQVEKMGLAIAAQPAMRVAAYDASNSGAGVQAWPPTPRDVPDRYGDIPYSMDPIPESLSFGVVMLLSSVAVLVGAFCFRKRPRVDNFSSGKLIK